MVLFENQIAYMNDVVCNVLKWIHYPIMSLLLFRVYQMAQSKEPTDTRILAAL